MAFRINKETVITSPFDGLASVTIRIDGSGFLIGACSQKADDFWDNYYEIFCLDTINGVYVKDNNGNEIEITKSKGKYIKYTDIFTKRLSIGIDHPLPVDIKIERYDIDNLTFEIPISDGDVFEPSKLQLIKSDYEFEFLPYAIDVYHVIYDGKPIETQCEFDFCLDSYDDYVIDDGDSLPYGYFGSNLRPCDWL